MKTLLPIVEGHGDIQAVPVLIRRILQHHNIFDKATTFPENPEAIRGAKEWLSKAMPSGYAYKETVHQVKLSAVVDLDCLRESSASYRHLEKSILSLVGTVA